MSRPQHDPSDHSTHRQGSIMPLHRALRFSLLLLLSVLLIAASGCSDETSSNDSGSIQTTGPSPGVGQGGAQDFGLFRAVVEAGGIPAPDVLDDVGFFNEHKLQWPTPDCGDDLCVHGLLGVMGNMITGSNCTLVLIGLNTPIDPSTLERPPLNLSIAVDVSGSMSGDSIRFVREGLLNMLETLSSNDRITLVTYNTTARTLVDNVGPSSIDLAAAIDTLTAEGSTNIYDGLRVAFEAVERNETVGAQNRVILLSDGVATAGIENDARIKRLAESYASRGIGITSIGVGVDFDVDLMRSIAEQGSGNFYFLEDPSAVVEVFTEEVETFLVPIAEDIRMRFKVGGGYLLRDIYGTRLASLGGDTGFVDIPSLFIAHRTSSSTTGDHGRRGGGGAIIAELLPATTPEAGFDPNEVGELIMDYRVPGTETIKTQNITIRSPLSPGDTPDAGHFESETVSKSFVMLNLYVGFKMASERAEAGDNANAIRVLDALEENIAVWLAVQPDDDVEDDLRILRLLRDNIQNNREIIQLPEAQRLPEPWPYD